MAVTTRETLNQILASELADAPESLAKFHHLLDQSGEVEFDFFLNEIDESDYSFADWIGGLLSFDEWLNAQGETRRPLPSMVSYMHCCTLTSATMVNLPELKVIVSQLLNEHGFDALLDSQI